MRLAILLSLGLAFAGIGFCQGNSPPQFIPYSGPTSVYPDTFVIFAVEAHGAEGSLVDYALLMSPTNVSFSVFFDRANIALLFWHTPSRSAVGTTNRFMVRATDSGSPPLSATNAIDIVVIEPPPIRSIQISNGVPVLQFDRLLPDKSYLVEWTAELPATHWTLLRGLLRTDPRPPVFTVADTNPPAAQRFYRIVPSSECYAGAACP